MSQFAEQFQTEQEAGIDIATRLANFANTYRGFNDNASRMAVTAMSCDHRTIQQNMMRFFMKFVEKMAQNHDSNHFDLRNEASVRLAKKIMEITERERILPYI